MKSKQPERYDSRNDSGVHTMTKTIGESPYLALFVGPPLAQRSYIVRICALHLIQLYQIGSQGYEPQCPLSPMPSRYRGRPINTTMTMQMEPISTKVSSARRQPRISWPAVAAIAAPRSSV